jgi:fibronectin-binding autotransporter adhesin
MHRAGLKRLGNAMVHRLVLERDSERRREAKVLLDEMTEPGLHRLFAGGTNRSAIPTFLWQTASFLVALAIVSSSAHAQDATWNFTPGSSDYNTPTNWTPTAAPIGPSGTASFGASGTTSLTFSTGTTVDTFQFNAGAPAYTFGLNGHFLEFTGNGIVNNSANAPTINAFGMLQFDNTATAGNAIINNTPGSTIFTGVSTAGTATITNSGGGLLSFTDFSNAGSATITTNAGSVTQFTTNSDGAQARFITNAGGTVDFSGTTGLEDSNLISAGSIEGAGTYKLGPNRLSVGSNNLSTVVSGTIGGGNASVVKEGSGTLTLSGVNTYSGGTSINSGTLLIAGAGTLGATTAPLSIGGGTLDLGGSAQTTGAMSMFGGSLANGALNSASFLVGGGLISATLIGSGALTQDGDGTTTLAAANTYAGGTAINSGTLEAAHASAGTINALSSGGITINSAGALRSSVNGTLGNGITFNDSSLGTLSAAAATTLTLTGGISLNSDSVTTFGTPTDTGTIVMNPSGISASTTASVLVGGGILRAGSFQLGSALGTVQSTTVNAGATLDLNDFSAAIHNFSGAGSVVTGTFANTNLALVVDPATSSEFSGVISGGGQVTVSGGGTMILSGDNTYGNGTSIMGGTTLQIGNGGATGSIIGDVRDGGTLVFNRSNTTTFAGVISDFSGDGPASAGSLVQNGAGTTILTANNTYTAGTTINAGTLQLGNGGTSGSISGNVLNNATFAINRSDAVAFGGVISGTGAFQQIGAGTTTLSAVQTYTGSTTISAGVLALTGTASIAASSGVVADAKFDISGLSAGTSITNLSGGSAGTVALGNNTLTLTNAAGAFPGAISGNGGLVKQGSGLFTLSGVSDYTGLTTVADGTLRVDGSVASALTVQSGATLSGTGSVGGLVTVQSGGTLSAGQSPGTMTFGALNLDAGSTSVFELGSPGIVGGATNDLVNVTGNLTLGGTLSVNAPSAGYYRLFNYGTLTASNFDTVTGSSNGTPTVLTNVPNQVNLSIAAAGQRIQFWDGADQTGNGVVNGGTGTWNATTTNWTGAPGQADINDQWRSSVGVFSGSAGTVTVGGAQAFDTLQFSTTGYVLNPGAGGQLQLSGLSGTGTINTDGGVAATINTPIVDGSSQTLTKVGGGTLILTAANSYTGGTTISGGTLQLGNGGATGSIIGDVIDNGAFAINRSDAFTFGGVISGTGAFNQIGTGSTTLTAIETYSGLTTISAGTLALTGAGSIANSSGVIANGVFDVSGVSAAGTSIKSLSGSGSVALGTKTLTLTNASGNFAGSIGGAGGLTLADGTQTLSGANAYGGATTITAGTLALAGAGSIANSSGVVANSVFDISALSGTGTSIKSLSGSGSVALGTKTLTLTNASGNFAGSIGGSGGVTLAAGTQLLSGVNGYTGATTITAGTLALAGAGSIASSSGVVANGAFDISGTSSGASIQTLSGSGIVTLGARTLTLTNASGNFAGSIGGGGGLTLAGGAETLSGTNTYTGGTTISAGTLTIAASGSITSNVNNNAAFSNAGTVTGSLTNAGTAANSGTISNGLNNNAGTTTNSGTINGGATVVGGTLNTNTATSVINGSLTNSATVNAQNQVNGAIVNQGSGVFNVVGNLAANSSFTNTGTAQLAVTGGNFAGITTLTNSSTGATGIAVSAGRTLSANAINNNAGAFISNSGTLTSFGGPVNNAGTLNSNAVASILSGGLTNTGTVNAQNQVNGAIVNQGAGAFNVAGNLAGNNSFTNNGTAQLLVDGGNFTGITTLTNNSTDATAVAVSANRTLSTTGTVTNAAGANIAVNGTFTAGQLLTNSGVVLVNSGGTLNATVGGITNTATGTITVALGGTVNDDLNNVGVVTNNGAYNAIVATNTGAITNSATGVWTGNVLSNAATISNSGVWNGTIANAGTFNNNAGATVSGLLTNTGGTTTNNGALNGGANISGGAFTGAGTVTNLMVSGGTFAPGTGTPGSSMTVTGNLAFQSGAMYLVTLNPTTASFASVGGTASLNGSAAAVYLAGNYVSKKYTILTAAGGVGGTFGSLVNTNVPTNFTSSLSYDASHAYIDLTLNFIPNPAPNFGGGLNINQQNVANTLVNFFNTTGGIPLVFGTLTPAGLTIASGELGTGVIQSSIKANDMFLNLLLDPSVAGRAGGFAPASGASQFLAEDEALAYRAKASSAERAAHAMVTKAPLLAAQPVNRWSVWGAAYGGSALTDGNAVVGSHDTTARAYGVAAGADYKVSPDALIGFALAGGGTSYSIADALGTGRSDLVQAGVFGRQNIGATYLSAALAYGWQDVTTNRTVALAGADVLEGRFKAETFSGRFEGGHRIATPWAGLAPYVAAQVISFNLPAYAERTLAGAGTFALNYAAQTTTATRTELGLRADKSFAMQDGIFTLRGRGAWAHDYNNDRAVTAIFQTLPGASFIVNGARPNPDGALVSAGAEMKWINGLSLAATFEGEFSGNTTSYAGKGVAKYTW